MAKLKENCCLSRKARGSAPYISSSFLAKSFKLDAQCTFLGVIESAEDDTDEFIPVLAIDDGDRFVNLTTGKLCFSSPLEIVYGADVSYNSQNEVFQFWVLREYVADISKENLVKTFGAGVIA